VGTGVNQALDFDKRLRMLEQRLVVLPDKPDETAESTLRALWLTAAGNPVSAGRAVHEVLPELSEADFEELDRLTDLRVSGVPLGHLTGRQMFCGIELLAGPAALLPRRETEALAKAAATAAEELRRSQDSVLMVDTCCGSGNVLFAVAHVTRGLRGIGVDLSDEALALARLNSQHFGFDDRVDFRKGDLFSPIGDVMGGADLVTCNPPYISTAKVHEMATEISSHEPEMAFDGGPFGIRILQRLVKEAPAVLKSGGYLLFEVGLGQGDHMMARVAKHGAYASCEPILDDADQVRAIRARRV
jgi:release factor glutamine methyltransferase